MSLKIRLARGGAKKRPYYRIVVADARSPRDGRFIEKIGTYNPMLPKDGPTPRWTLDVESAKSWLAKGAQPTDRVLRFFDAEGLMKREARNNPNKGEPGKKAQERIAEKAKLAEAAEAAKAAAAAAVVAAAAAATEAAEAAKAAAAEAAAAPAPVVEEAPAVEEAAAAEDTAAETPAADETAKAE